MTELQKALVTDEDTVQFWFYMTQAFGNLWVNNYGDTPAPLWTDRLKKLTRQQLARGKEAIEQRGYEYPPTLPQFISQCKYGPDGIPRPATDTSDRQLLEDQRTSSPTTIKKHIDQMMNTLGSSAASREGKPSSITKKWDDGMTNVEKKRLLVAEMGEIERLTGKKFTRTQKD